MLPALTLLLLPAVATLPAVPATVALVTSHHPTNFIATLAGRANLLTYAVLCCGCSRVTGGVPEGEGDRTDGGDGLRGDEGGDGGDGDEGGLYVADGGWRLEVEVCMMSVQLIK